MDATYAILMDADAEPATLDLRLDEPLPGEVTPAEKRRLELRRDAIANQDALAALRGVTKR